MKKLLTTVLILLLSNQLVLANTESLNMFDILLKDVPVTPTIPAKDDGLSDGEKTAITLGSIFGGLALGGIAYNLFSKGIVLCGCSLNDKDTFLIPMCFKDKKEHCNYPKLHKIITNENLDRTCKKKYILIQDTFIENKTFKRVFFKVDKNYSKVTIYQYSNPFETKKNIPNLNTHMFQDNTEIPFISITIDKENGILRKKSNYKFKRNSLYFIDTSLIHKQTKNVYAIVLEFE